MSDVPTKRAPRDPELRLRFEVAARGRLDDETLSEIDNHRTILSVRVAGGSTEARAAPWGPQKGKGRHGFFGKRGVPVHLAALLVSTALSGTSCITEPADRDDDSVISRGAGSDGNGSSSAPTVDCAEAVGARQRSPATEYGNNARTGEFAGVGAPTLAEEAWRKRVPGAVAMFVLKGLVIVARFDETIALDAEDGRTVWRRSHRGSVANAVDPSRMVLLSPSDVRLLDVASGEQVWRLPYPIEPEYVLGSTLVGDQVLLATTDALFVIDAVTGEFEREAEVPGEPELPAVHSGVAYLTGEHDETLATDLATGETLWFVNGVGSTFAAPTVSCGLLLIGGINATVALDTASGTLVWSVPTRQSNDTVAASGETIFIPMEDGMLAVDASSGDAIWRVRGIGEPLLHPAVAGGHLYVIVNGDGVDRSALISLSTRDGSKRSERKLPGLVSFERNSNTVIVGKNVMVLLADGTVLSISD